MSASLREQLEEIRAEHGKLTPKLVVDVARDQSHPLHSRLEWDDAVAGEAYRLTQAHELIRSVRIKYRKPDSDTETKIRFYHAVPMEDGSGYAYDPADEIANDPLRRQMVLRDMERDWRALRARYAEFEEFVELVRADLEAAAA